MVTSFRIKAVRLIAGALLTSTTIIACASAAAEDEPATTTAAPTTTSTTAAPTTTSTTVKPPPHKASSLELTMALISVRARRTLTEARLARLQAATTTTIAPAPPAPAPAPTPPAVAPGPVEFTTWDRLAQCEAGGNWSINTGNGYSGGLQWAPGTWSSYKAPDDPAYAWQASREQQIAAGERLLAASGGRFTAWPGCRAALHLP